MTFQAPRMLTFGWPLPLSMFKLKLENLYKKREIKYIPTCFLSKKRVILTNFFHLRCIGSTGSVRTWSDRQDKILQLPFLSLLPRMLFFKSVVSFRFLFQKCSRVYVYECAYVSGCVCVDVCRFRKWIFVV